MPVVFIPTLVIITAAEQLKMRKNAEASGSNSPTTPDSRQDPFDLTARAAGIDQSLGNLDLKPDISFAHAGVLSESTPLLQHAFLVAKNPKAYAEERLERMIKRLTGPLLAYIPDVENGEELDNQSLLLKIALEVYILLKHSVPLFL